MNKSFAEVLSCASFGTNAGVDWERLEKTDIAPLLASMRRTAQEPSHHGEGNVYLHTRAVCEALMREPEYLAMTAEAQSVMFTAALLHDIGKIICTREENGMITSPYHSVKGAMLARELLWRDFGVCGSEEKRDFRETVCHLIRYHSFPPKAIEREQDERYFLRMASCGALAKGFSLRRLCLLEKADVKGRISRDNEAWLENIECCLMLAQDFECADAPFEFASDFTQRAYFKGKTDWKRQQMYDDTWGTVILMSGLPGTGKDTWIRDNCPDIPMVSLDLWREKLGISPKENQGAVIAAARDEAKEYLRKKQPFVWNATNISEQIRSAQISLFEDYGASVRTVFLETEWGEEMRRNGERKATVPTSAIEKMLQKLEIPERSESAEVEWKIV